MAIIAPAIMPMISAVFSAASDEMRSRFLRLGCRGVGNGMGSKDSSVLVVVEVLLVPGLLSSADDGLLLMLLLLLYPLVDEEGISEVLEYGFVLL